MRLTKKREEEIKQWSCTQYIETANTVMELLAEIDYLRDELEFRHSAAKNYAESCGILRAKLEYYQKNAINSNQNST